MGAAVRGAISTLQSGIPIITEYEEQAGALLLRCRRALCWTDPQWEQDVGAAIEEDEALVRDVDAFLRDSA
jgi:hypothetical protein